MGKKRTGTVPGAKGASGLSATRVRATLDKAIALHLQGQLAQAQALYERVLTKHVQNFDALRGLGLIAAQSNDHRRAAELTGRAIEVFAQDPVSHRTLGNALKELGQFEAAVASHERAIALKPDYADAFSDCGVALEGLGRLDAALEKYDRALALRPNYPDALYNRGNALLSLGQFDAAIASYDRAIALRPDVPVYYGNRGNALMQLRRIDAAIASFDQAGRIRPGYAEAYWNKALALLLAGDFERGWRLHEWRWESAAFTSPKRNFPQPLWLGEAPLAGKTILLHAEQGLGDAIQFCRYAPQVADLGAQVVLEVAAPLAGLLGTLAGVSCVVVSGDPLPAFDCHCPLLSLPLAFKTDLASIPRAPSYLRADAGTLARWTQRLGRRSGPRIGLVWSGSSGHGNDRNRSIALADLLAHLPARCEYFSLQKEVRDADRPALEASPGLRHFGDELADFTDTAALCELMDAVVSVDTAAAHLSGALGKPVCVLLPFVPDWRWLLDRDDSPWYPSARLYRQTRAGEWDPVLAKVAAELAAIGQT